MLIRVTSTYECILRSVYISFNRILVFYVYNKIYIMFSNNKSNFFGTHIQYNYDTFIIIFTFSIDYYYLLYDKDKH